MSLVQEKYSSQRNEEINSRGVAQLARAFVSKTKGSEFESRHPCNSRKEVEIEIK